MKSKPWQAIAIPSEKDTTFDAFGISEERLKELQKILEKAHEENKKITETLEQATGECMNINEAIFIAFQYGEKLACMGCPVQSMNEGELPPGIEEFVKFISKKLKGPIGGMMIEIKPDDDDDE